MNTTMPQDPFFNKQYQKHLKCLKLGGLQPKTIDAYARAIRRIGNYFDCRVDNLNSDQLLDYFMELLDTHSWSAVKLDLYGLKFFYSGVLHKPWEDIPLIRPPRTSRIPDILSVEQTGQLFAATNTLSYKGLRLGEGIRLTVGDIDAGNMRAHIRNAKGNKDRLVPLPDKTLQVLREFWAMHKHPRFLFPSRKRGLKNAHLVDLPLDRGGIQTAIQSVVRHLGIKKNLMPLPASQLCHPHAGGRG
jgi:integrase